jgi:hypothetical protein
MEKAHITIRWETGAYELILPEALGVASPAMLDKRVFRVLMTEDYRRDNKETIAFLDDWLPRWVAERKLAWEVASLEFQHGYVDPDYGYCADKKAALANNKKLLQAVKSSRRAHDRAAGILQRWEDAKKKYLT